MFPDPTLLTAPERNRYFYGLLMDTARFEKDQHYFNRKRHLLNRFVTGRGVVCGLDLNFDKAKKSLTLGPGMALDGFGREIIVPAATPVDITQLTDAHGKPTGPAPPGATLLISLAYAEKKIDPVPVLVPDCDHPNGCAPSAIEEIFAVLVREAKDPPPTIPGCIFGSAPLTPAELQKAIAKWIVDDLKPAAADPSVALGRLTLPDGPLDAVEDRPVVYDNTLLHDLIVCLAARVSAIPAVITTYVSGDNQSAKAGKALAAPLVVALVDNSGNPVTSGSPPVFTVQTGVGSVSVVTPGAGPGQYQTTWTMGSAGAQTVTAQSPQSTIAVTFNATAKP